QLGNGSTVFIFSSKKFCQQEVQLRKSGAQVQALRFKRALFRIVKPVEIEIRGSVIEVRFGVIHRVKIEDIATDVSHRIKVQDVTGKKNNVEPFVFFVRQGREREIGRQELTVDFSCLEIGLASGVILILFL